MRFLASLRTYGPAAAGGLLLVACASSAKPAPASIPVHELPLEEAIAARGLDPADVIIPNRLSPEMKRWLTEKVRYANSSFDTLRDLVDELQKPHDLRLVYEPGFTGTAQEVFESGRYNCLSFTHLFVGMARELGAEAYYLSVFDVETYRRDGDLVVRSGHVTAAYSEGPIRRVLEFDVGPDVDYRFTQRISDLTAVAMYYSNRGAELLRDRDPATALGWLETAVRLDPKLADAWTNLGVARRRLGDLDGAERAYREAVAADPDSFSGYLNLTALYRLRGEVQTASKLLRLLDQRRNRNPFIYLALGDESLSDGRLDDARRFYRKALHYSDDPAEARAALGQRALAAGEPEVARKWLRRAMRADATEPRIRVLLEALREADPS